MFYDDVCVQSIIFVVVGKIIINRNIDMVKIFDILIKKRVDANVCRYVSNSHNNALEKISLLEYIFRYSIVNPDISLCLIKKLLLVKNIVVPRNILKSFTTIYELQFPIVELLLNQDIDINCSVDDNNDTYVDKLFGYIEVTNMRSDECIKILKKIICEKDCDFSHKSFEGVTYFHMLCKLGMKDIVGSIISKCDIMIDE